jgi:putative zinc finger/helix-turn-helix YgiT family protein
MGQKEEGKEIMYCTNCEYDKSLKPHNVTKKFDESGLSNITLKGVVEFRCPNCGETYLNYGNLDQLYELIAGHLIRKKELLTAKEVRFLRKYMGYSSAMLAKLVGQKPEHISRLENEKTKITELFDHYIRMLVIQKFPDRNYDLHDHILNDTGENFSRLEAHYKNKKWDVRAIG